MPLLRRLFWPWLIVPAIAVGVVLSQRPLRPVHALFAVMLVGLFFGIYAALVGAYRQWSVPPPRVDGALASPEPVVLVSRGGFLTPGSGVFTKEQLFVYANGRPVVTVPLERLGRVAYIRGRWLKTPYVELFAKDGRSLGRLGVESAEAWARKLDGLIGSAADLKA